MNQDNGIFWWFCIVFGAMWLALEFVYRLP